MYEALRHLHMYVAFYLPYGPAGGSPSFPHYFSSAFLSHEFHYPFSSSAVSYENMLASQISLKKKKKGYKPEAWATKENTDTLEHLRA